MGIDVIGMEQYAADSSRPAARCKRDVEVADVYVLILGWRYGYVPEHDNEAAQSVTEIEYRHVQATNMPILAFLLDPETPGLRIPWTRRRPTEPLPPRSARFGLRSAALTWRAYSPRPRTSLACEVPELVQTI
jgi:Domain of unknown function (DUF4062)